MLSKTFNDLISLINTLPVISSHEHHLEDQDHINLNLDLILENSYIGHHVTKREEPAAQMLHQDDNNPVKHRCGIKYLLPSNNPGIDAEELAAQRQHFLDLHGTNSYFVWLEKGLQKIYDLEGEITPEKWAKKTL